MKFEIHHYTHAVPDTRISDLLCAVQQLVNKVGKIMSYIEELEAAVKANTDVIASAVILINGISQKLHEAGTDPAKLAALTSELTNSRDALAAAVAANTDTPVVDAPVVDVPVVDTPVVDAPVVDTPVVDVPAVDTPVVDTPVVDTPSTDA